MLYFRERNRTEEVLEDAVVVRIRRNGFHVFIPKFGLKGAVYLLDKTGKSLIPDNVLSLASAGTVLLLPPPPLLLLLPLSIFSFVSFLSHLSSFFIFSSLKSLVKEERDKRATLR
jgi:DIS3-like exonuclease 1